MDTHKTMIFLGTTVGLFTASRIFGLDFDLFNPDEPVFQEPTVETTAEPRMSENFWDRPMIVGLTLAGIAIVAAVGICCWKMLKTEEEIPLIKMDEEDQTEPAEEISNNEEIPNTKPLIETDGEFFEVDEGDNDPEIKRFEEPAVEIPNAEPLIETVGEFSEADDVDDDREIKIFEDSEESFVLNREEILRVNAEEIETDVEDQTEPAYEIPNGEEISNDDWETDDEDQTEPPFWNLRNRKINRKRR